jgi:hypothetical protein
MNTTGLRTLLITSLFCQLVVLLCAKFLILDYGRTFKALFTLLLGWNAALLCGLIVQAFAERKLLGLKAGVWLGIVLPIVLLGVAAQFRYHLKRQVGTREVQASDSLGGQSGAAANRGRPGSEK